MLNYLVDQLFKMFYFKIDKENYSYMEQSK